MMMKHAKCHGYTMQELSNGDVQVISPAGLPIARTVSFREAVKIIETDVKILNRYGFTLNSYSPVSDYGTYKTDGTEDPFQ